MGPLLHAVLPHYTLLAQAAGPQCHPRPSPVPDGFCGGFGARACADGSELDPAQPRLNGQSPALYRFIHYYRLNSTAATLEALLHTFPFARLADLPLPATSASYRPNPQLIQRQQAGLTGQPVLERGQEK